MKTKITSILFTLILWMTSFSTKADVFYVVSGEPFKLTPSVLSLYQYNWELSGAATALNNITTVLGTSPDQGAYLNTFTLPVGTTVALTNTLKLSVLDVVGGCLSNLATHSIIVLPKLTTTIASSVEKFCQDEAFSTELTASALTNIADIGSVDLAYQWYNGATLITNQTTNKLTVTQVGNYICKVTYVITNSESKISSKVASAITEGARNIVQETKTAIPVLSID